MYAYKLKIYNINDVINPSNELIPDKFITNIEAEDDFDMESQLQDILKDKYDMRYIGYNYNILTKIKIL